jgi:sarcosine oxidase subunit delta
MRIPCPHCGERDASEFSFLGDASAAKEGLSASAEEAHRAVYLRDNPAGLHREIWYHAAGCRACLIVTRNTLTHRIETAETARKAHAKERI